MRRSLMFLILLILSLVPSGVRSQESFFDIVILYDNDAHCAVDGYARMAALRNEMDRRSLYVSVVSCGDFVAGGPLGAYSQGGYIARIMNAVGYDCVVPGNHEFDYRVPRLLEIDSMLTAVMLCCNFYDLEEDDLVFDAYTVRKYGEKRVAFVGVTTPSTPSATSPKYYMDEYGPLYTFGADSLVSIVQRQVDRARKDSADYVVLLSHLGDCDGSPTSVELIRQTSGIDVMLDGHSHSVIEQRKVLNKDGKTVILSSTGASFANIGCLTISVDGQLSTRLIAVNDETPVDSALLDTIASIRNIYNAVGRSVVGYSEATLLATDSKGLRLARIGECGLGDFCADAFRVVMGADIGWVNGGGIRGNIKTGELTYADLYDVFPFENKVMLVSVSGQDILDALEVAAAKAPHASGRFAQVSGLSYRIDTTISSSVVIDSNEVFVRVEGRRRVRDVKVADRASGLYLPLEYGARYTLAASDYVLSLLGSGHSFPSQKVIKVAPFNDAQLLQRYVSDYLSGRLPSDYAQPDGRIRYR